MALRFAQGLPESSQVMLICIRRYWANPSLVGTSAAVSSQPNFLESGARNRIICQRTTWVGYHYYGPRTVRIGPHPLLKWGVDVDLAEVNATHFLENHSTVPVPKAWKHGKVTAIIMQFGGGEPLAAMQYADVCSQLKT